jgi:hypothetical protein
MGGHGVEKMKQYVAELNHGNAKEQGMGPRRTCSAQGEMHTALPDYGEARRMANKHWCILGNYPVS